MAQSLYVQMFVILLAQSLLCSSHLQRRAEKLLKVSVHNSGNACFAVNTK